MKPRPLPTPIVFTDLDSLVRERPDPGRVTALVRLSQLVERPEPRGEFETEAEYRQRLATFANPVGQYERDTQFAIVLPASSSYDIDKGRLTVSADGGSETAPTISLSSSNLPSGSYVGQNAFGVSREVYVRREEKLVFIPIARIAAPRGCNFGAGAPKAAMGTTLVDAESLIKWACGLRYVETNEIESLARFHIPMSPTVGKEARAGPLFLAYIVSFELPIELEAHAGPMTYSKDAPTLNSPFESQVIGEAMTARLKRAVVFSRDGKVWFDRSFD